MPSLIRSRSMCPWCGSPLYYVNERFSFLTGKKKRVCIAAECGFVDPRSFKILTHRSA